MEEKVSLKIAKDSMETATLKTNNVYFFTASTVKLITMSICTMGLYELYWFYKNWVLIKDRTGEDMMPFWRAFFAPLWAYSCFKHVKSEAVKFHIEESLSLVMLAIGYFIVQALWRLPDPYWLVSYLTFALLIPVNSVAIQVNKQVVSDFENNEKFSVWNWVILVIGGFLFVLILIGAFLPGA